MLSWWFGDTTVKKKYFKKTKSRFYSKKFTTNLPNFGISPQNLKTKKTFLPHVFLGCAHITKSPEVPVEGDKCNSSSFDMKEQLWPLHDALIDHDWSTTKTHLEPQTTIYKWMFGETTIFYIKIWNHPIETTIYKWLFGVPGKNLMVWSRWMVFSMSFLGAFFRFLL